MIGAAAAADGQDDVIVAVAGTVGSRALQQCSAGGAVAAVVNAVANAADSNGNGDRTVAAAAAVVAVATAAAAADSLADPAIGPG